ncbi:ISAzo13 family transposase [Granulosicoccus antarcticus]|uniref:ISAzo13 family transposase n=1 Tax=Granulosicoccus antarcticus IMCC3135 TaxID=1192854 RepID=A0A2Z2PA33_9GAMM|nr:ISAzo13 family transposase [Granulosicoccus antarcticus]ASJ76744.1 hypothetical protein IMCC3135_33500 [Granulosicoccus antarcticus IMCC3135]
MSREELSRKRLVDKIGLKYSQILPSLDERGRREWAATEAMALGHGGITIVHEASALSMPTIRSGIAELMERNGGAIESPRRVRRPGAGRPSKLAEDPELLGALESLVEPGTRGDPQSPLRWTTKSVRVLANELGAAGHSVSFRSVSTLLKQLGYSLQGNAKTIEGAQHPDRNAQFLYIAKQSKRHIKAAQPALSVDTKKKELVGAFKNGGQEYRPKGEPEKVKTHDFKGELGRVAPYGVYDIADNDAWVNVGISADTAEFAVQSIRRWWQTSGKARYGSAREIFITADCGGSNGYRSRLWKLELQGLSDELGRSISVSHFPPGTSKWNRIEHRLFSFITMNWRGKPLYDYRTVIELIGATKTEQGLEVRCELDTNTYEKGRKVTDEEMESINLHPHKFHGEWNYTIKPRE